MAVFRSTAKVTAVHYQTVLKRPPRVAKFQCNLVKMKERPIRSAFIGSPPLFSSHYSILLHNNSMPASPVKGHFTLDTEPETMSTTEKQAPSSPSGNSNSNISTVMHTPSSPVVSPPAQIVPQWECDYDESPSDLYQAIEAKQWEFILGMFSEGVSEVAAASVRKQCATWVVRKESNGRLRWRLLPLHAACIFQAPSLIIKFLLEDFPHGAAAKDDQGMLPLHLAFRQQPVNFNVLEELMTAFPAAVTVKDRRGRTPLQAVQGVEDGPTSPVNPSDPNQALVANSGAPAAVISLYSQITLAAAKQDWTAAQKKNMDQRLNSVADEHAARWTHIKSDFNQQVNEMKAKMAVLQQEKAEAEMQRTAESKAHNNVLTKSQQQLKVSQLQLTELRAAADVAPPPTPPVAVAVAAPTAVAADLKSLPSLPGVKQTDHTELASLVETLLEQQGNLMLNLSNMATELEEKRQERARLLKAMGALDATPDTTPTSVSRMKTQVEATHAVVSTRLASLVGKHTLDEQDAAIQQEESMMEQELETTQTLLQELGMSKQERVARTQIPTPSNVQTVLEEKKDEHDVPADEDKMDILGQVSVSKSEEEEVETIVASGGRP